MSKVFEDAYIADVQQNIPDLWNRIESNLPEKKIEKKVPVKKKNPYAWIKWATLAAAGLFVVLVIPAVAGLGLLGIGLSKSESEGAATMESGADMMNQMATGEIKYEAEDNMEAAEEETYAEDVIAEGGAVAEDSYEFLDEESAATESLQSAETYREFVMDDVYAEVTEVTVTEDGYSVKLEVASISRILTDIEFENNPFYEDGVLRAIVYDGTGEVPVVGEKYKITVFDRTPDYMSLLLPYEVVLEDNAS